MKIIDAANLDYRAVNEALRGTDRNCTIEGCCGQSSSLPVCRWGSLQSMEFREMHWVHI